jgi:hypothetical protein
MHSQRYAIVSISHHFSQFGSCLIVDLNALLFVHTVLLRTWNTVSLLLKVMDGWKTKNLVCFVEVS